MSSPQNAVDWQSLVRPAAPDDSDFIVKTWISSFFGSPWSGTIPNDKFNDVTTSTIMHLLTRGAKVRAVSNPAAPNQLVAWACYELDLDGKTVLHYLFVKPIYRRLGISHVLLRSAGIDSADDFFYTFKTTSMRFYPNGTYRPEIARSKSISRRKARPSKANQGAVAVSANP